MDRLTIHMTGEVAPTLVGCSEQAQTGIIDMALMIAADLPKPRDFALTIAADLALMIAADLPKQD